MFLGSRLCRLSALLALSHSGLQHYDDMESRKNPHYPYPRAKSTTKIFLLNHTSVNQCQWYGELLAIHQERMGVRKVFWHQTNKEIDFTDTSRKYRKKYQNKSPWKKWHGRFVQGCGVFRRHVHRVRRVKQLHFTSKYNASPDAHMGVLALLCAGEQ
jgi:hypothetical protein